MGYRYSVESDSIRNERAQVALVRKPEAGGVMGRPRGRSSNDVTVLLRRGLSPPVELIELDRYAATLRSVAEHANEQR